MDFVEAFLNNKLNVELYIKVPKGLYEFSLSSPKALDLLKRHNWNPFKNQIILLGKGLYGPKQASHL